MTTKNTKPGDAAPPPSASSGQAQGKLRASSGQALRRRAEEIVRERATRSEEDLEALTPEAMRQTLHELRVHQIELTMQNEELRRAQAELEAVRARYFDLYDLAPVGYVTVSEKGLILEANLTAATLLDVTRGALVQQLLTRFILKEDQDIYYRHRKQLLETGEPQAFELRMVKKDGTAFWVNLEATAAQDPSTNSGPTADGAPVGRVVISDITERKFREDKLRESEERFRLLLEQAPEAIVVFDIDEQRIVLANAKAEKLFGYSREELLRVGPEFFYAPIQPDGRPIAESMKENNERALAGEEVVMELAIRNAEGKGLICEFHLARFPFKNRRLIRNSYFDITGRKRAEGELMESKALIDAVVENVPLMIFLKEATDLRFVIFNRAGEELLGYDRQALLGKNNLDLFPPEQAAHFMAKDREVLDGEAGMLDIPEEFILTAKKGQRLLHTRKVCILGADGTTKYLLGISEDITERKQVEEEKAKLEAQLQQAQKMESVGRLAGGVAHDFNNMLGVILGHAELAIDQVDPAQPLRANLEEIKKAAQRSADLTRQLLAFARKQTVQPQVLDLNETVGSMLQMLRRLIGENINLAWLPGAGVWPVKVDPGQIDQVLANLCVNAHDDLADVGQVAIETGNSALDEAYCAAHAGFVPGEYVWLALSDDGCGMDRETLACIFEPFFTTKGVGEGTGMGLATVYGIVKQNNGLIDVASEPGKGTTFTIYLPRHLGQAEPARTQGASEPAWRGQETILLVEDEPAILAMTRLMLERQGYTVLSAGTPGEAMRLAEEYAGEINLLMTDVVMPEMNGRDLAQRLQSLYTNLKRLFMSGYTADVIARHGVLEQGVHFIQKPFSLEDLAAKVRETLDTQ